MTSQIILGARFDSLEKLKQACRMQAVRSNFETRTLRSNRVQFELRCKAEGCPWRLYAASIERTSMFTIRSLHEEHTCFGINHTGNNAATSEFLANIIANKIKEQPDYRPSDIEKDVSREFGVKVSYSKAYRAKKAAKRKIDGTHEETYARLPKYCQDLEAANPGSTIILCKTDSNKFQRLFLCYEASAVGFVSCRPLLGLDGTHLKSKYQGILLAATATDARGSLFPLAFGIVDIENDDNWLWFLSNVRSVLETHIPTIIDEDYALTLLSDRQKGLVEAANTVFPHSAHGYCLKHLEANFYKAYKHPELKSLLWKAARAITVDEFEEALQNMRTINYASVDWLLSHAHPMHWAEVYFSGHRYGHLTSNIAESLNSWLLQAREQPLLPMLETIRHQLMHWFVERRDSAVKLNDAFLVSEVSKAMQALMIRARRYRSINIAGGTYEVKSLETFKEYAVDLERGTCSCHAYQSQGFPCGHAINVILSKREDPQKYAKPFFTVAAYTQTYANAIFPPAASVDLNFPLEFEDSDIGLAWLAGGISDNDVGSESDKENEEDSVLNPPNTRRPVGRPKKRWIRTQSERRPFRCGRCKALGHNSRSCTSVI